jgi:hypothetical protein
MISANLNASTMMIADKASDLIRGRTAPERGGRVDSLARGTDSYRRLCNMPTGPEHVGLSGQTGSGRPVAKTVLLTHLRHWPRIGVELPMTVSALSMYSFYQQYAVS